MRAHLLDRTCSKYTLDDEGLRVLIESWCADTLQSCQSGISLVIAHELWAFASIEINRFLYMVFEMSDDGQFTKDITSHIVTNDTTGTSPESQATRVRLPVVKDS